MILAPGGGFTEGDKSDFDDLAKSFAQSGYVAATGGLSGTSGKPGAGEKIKGVFHISVGLVHANL